MRHQHRTRHGTLGITPCVVALLVTLLAACSDAPTDPSADESSVVQEGVLADGTPVIEYLVRGYPQVGSGSWFWGRDPEQVEQMYDEELSRWIYFRASTFPIHEGDGPTWHSIQLNLVPDELPPMQGTWGIGDHAPEAFFDPSTFGTAIVTYDQGEGRPWGFGRRYNATEGTLTIDRVYEGDFDWLGVREALDGTVEARVKATEPYHGYPDEYLIRVRFTLFRSTPGSW